MRKYTKIAINKMKQMFSSQLNTPHMVETKKSIQKQEKFNNSLGIYESSSMNINQNTVRTVPERLCYND